MFAFIRRLIDRNSAWKDFEIIFQGTQYDKKFVRKYFYGPFHKGFNHGYAVAEEEIRHCHGPECTSGWNVQFNGCVHKLMQDSVLRISNQLNSRPSDIFTRWAKAAGLFLPLSPMLFWILVL